MKILCICYGNMALQSGEIRQVIEIAKHLKKIGHEVEVCAPLIERYKGEAPFPLRYIPVLNFSILRPLSYHLLSFVYLLIRGLKFRPDIFLNYEVVFTFIPFLTARIFRRPSLFFVNGIAAEEFDLKGAPKLLVVLLRLFQKINMSLASKIITVTEVIKQDITNKYGVPSDKIEIVKNGIDPKLFKPLEKKEIRDLGFEGNDHYVGFVGRLFPWHGLEYLVKSAPLILKEVRNLKFIIVGEGRKESLIQLIEDLKLDNDFIFTGEVAFDLVPKYINLFDIGVVFFKPVRKNPGDPMKLYEYLACGKPVVASNVEGYGDFAEDIGAGISVDSSDPRALAEAIVKLIRDEELRNRMGERGRAAVVREHTWEMRAKQIESYMKEIILKA